MKSLLHVALIAPNGYSNAGLMKGFFDAGFTEYHLFDFQLKTFETDRDTMRRMLIQEAERLKPDMIFMQIQGSDILDIATFKRLSEISFTVNYTFDIRTKEQTEWLYNLAPMLGLICFSNQRDVDECNSRGHRNSMVLQSSCDMDVYVPRRFVLTPNFVSFIGNNYFNTNMPFPLSEERVSVVNRLRGRFGKSFGVWGMGWENSQMTTPGQESKIYDTSSIAINHNNFREKLYTSDRIWRIMASGVFCLTSYFEGIETLFTRGEHLDWWHDVDELESKVGYYLLYPEIANQIAVNGTRHVRITHTWTSRIKEMLNFIGPVQKKVNSNACLSFGAHVIDATIPTPADQHFDGRTCSCKKLIWRWKECGCVNKEYQLMAEENI